MAETMTPAQPAPVVREWPDNCSVGSILLAVNPFIHLPFREAIAEHNAAIRHLRAEVEALTAEAKVRETTLRIERLVSARLQNEKQAAKADNARLRKALEKYGAHLDVCDALGPPGYRTSGGWVENQRRCNCGLDAEKTALAEAKP